jgi:Uma2 family endonuclease
MMVQAPKLPEARAALTLEAFLAMPETKPGSEFIDGVIFPKPMPQGKHSAIQTEFVSTVNGQLKRPKVARAFSELRCTFGGRSVIPDVSVFVWERIVRDAASGEVANVFAIAPDWTICIPQRYANEVLSPDQSQTRVVKNIVHCLKHGTQMGWLVDPDDRTVFVYQPDREIAIFDGPDDLLLMPGFAQGLALTVGEVFGWLMD